MGDSVFSRLTWPLATDRLSIRPARAEDAGAAWEYRRLPEVHRWITSAQATFEEFEVAWRSPDALGKTLVIELDGQVVGDLMLAVEDAWSQREVRPAAKDKQAELGWSLSPSYQGQGYAGEAIAALIGVCFADLGIHRLVANCFAANDASWRLMERLGMRREAHTIRDSLHRDLGWSDGLVYALLADEWPTV